MRGNAEPGYVPHIVTVRSAVKHLLSFDFTCNLCHNGGKSGWKGQKQNDKI